MNRGTLVGAGLCFVGLIGYVVGIYVTYPARAFTTTAVMVGITLVGISYRNPARGTA